MQVLNCLPKPAPTETKPGPPYKIFSFHPYIKKIPQGFTAVFVILTVQSPLPEQHLPAPIPGI